MPKLTKAYILKQAGEYFAGCHVCPDDEDLAGYVLDVFGVEGLKIALSI